MRALAVVAVMIYHANSEWLPGGFLGRRGLLRHQRLPDHAAADRREGAHRRCSSRSLLVAACPPAAPGVVRDDVHADHVHDDLPVGRARQAPWRRAGRAVLRVELVPDLGRGGLQLDRRLRAAAPPVEPRRRGAVLPGVAGRDGGVAAGRDAPRVRRGEVARRRRLGDHGRDGGAVPPGSGRGVQRHSGGLLDDRRPLHLEERRAVPGDAHPRRRAAARRRVRDGVAAVRGDARTAARQGSAARPARHRRARRTRRRRCGTCTSSRPTAPIRGCSAAAS